ncbi:MAG: RNA polymerase sporulation sigma factor SigK [Clostridia bacterium]|nr:RNA polymerase sporulation sigma factor SigK [Clostridia bacterium]
MIEFISLILGKILFFTGSVLSGNSFKKPLSEEEEKLLLIKARRGDVSAKTTLVEHNMRLVAHIVKKYKGSAETDDLISVGSMGLAKAINTFDYEKGARLATFASRCIENEILMLLRANKKHKVVVSLYDDVGTDKDGNTLKIVDTLTEDEDVVFKNANDKILRDTLIKKMQEVLTKREFIVIVMRYGIGTGECYAQREVASFLKISRSYISRIEKKALEKLRTVIDPKDFLT